MNGDRRKLKYEGFKVGDQIKAFDFQPRAEIGERYIVGTIEAVDCMEQGALTYRVRVIEDTAAPKGARIIVMVPYEVSFLEWDGRVTLVEEGK